MRVRCSSRGTILVTVYLRTRGSCLYSVTCTLRVSVTITDSKTVRSTIAGAQAVVTGVGAGALTQHGLGLHCAAHGSQQRALRQWPASAADPSANTPNSIKHNFFINSPLVTSYTQTLSASPKEIHLTSARPIPVIPIIRSGRLGGYGKSEITLRLVAECEFCEK